MYKDPDYMKKWRAANKERLRAYDKNRYAADPEGQRARVKEYYRNNADKRREYGRKYHQENREDCLARQKKWAERRRKELRYGITPEQWQAMWESQGEACAICGTASDRPHVDHDHKTGVVRGILCHHCNVGLGHAFDDPATLRKMAAYLEENRS